MNNQYLLNDAECEPSLVAAVDGVELCRIELRDEGRFFEVRQDGRTLGQFARVEVAHWSMGRILSGEEWRGCV